MMLTKEDRKDGKELVEMFEKLTPEEKSQATIYISALSDRKMIEDAKKKQRVS